MADRDKYLKDLNRIVVKIGSSSLTTPDNSIDVENMEKFCLEVLGLVNQGIQVIVVTSGAIAAGLQYLNIKGRPGQISKLQAAASVGQVELMRIYRDYMARKNIKVGQILLTHEDTTGREQYLNIRATINTLLDMDIIPVINENDSVAVDEIKFGDNDQLAALVASLTESGLLVLLSDIDGLYDKHPGQHKDARIISTVEKITPEIEELAGGAGSIYGLGGMVSKIKAAKICNFSNVGMVIANSRKPRVLKDIIEGKQVGTFFVPGRQKRVKSVKRWIAFGMRTKGSIVIDQGAREAITNQGKSLLPVGVVRGKGQV
ncbi:MAG: glutamate 5-kinase [Actinomycetota bacterium]|nr:glutamate 5-kinase [Actinomycetota bacterium]